MMGLIHFEALKNKPPKKKEKRKKEIQRIVIDSHNIPAES